MDCCVPQYDMHFWDDYTCLKTSQGNVCSPAEASIRELTAGVVEYQRVVPVSKLVLGLPWYGQRYTLVAGVPFNEGQVDYKDVLNVTADTHRVKSDQVDKKQVENTQAQGSLAQQAASKAFGGGGGSLSRE